MSVSELSSGTSPSTVYLLLKNKGVKWPCQARQPWGLEVVKHSSSELVEHISSSLNSRRKSRFL